MAIQGGLEVMIGIRARGEGMVKDIPAIPGLEGQSVIAQLLRARDINVLVPATARAGIEKVAAIVTSALPGDIGGERHREMEAMMMTSMTKMNTEGMEITTDHGPGHLCPVTKMIDVVDPRMIMDMVQMDNGLSRDRRYLIKDMN
eukprot:TRINITY_DN10848_c0_g1_i1.p2 TRINITY_DN10848_c0_g1~~TRINITY_DN10848_c0_g1_i1.p2  ORF type:complete len:145 (+),score=7.87 TRINITY_DN10848_c0_g1_i1:389-823(+)